jgi:hypothetical protein
MEFTNGSQVMESERSPDPAILIVPGWAGSGASHWQTIWERDHPEYRRVEQRNWNDVYRPEWVAGLEQAVLAVPEDVLLVAHSLGCLTVAWWAATRGCAWRNVRGAMLVAPPDLVSSPGCLPALASFMPVPRRPLPFPSVLVASRNDPYATLDAASDLAAEWGSAVIDAGAAGHINVDSGHGPWPEGHLYLERLMSGIRRPEKVAASFFG